MLVSLFLVALISPLINACNPGPGIGGGGGINRQCSGKPEKWGLMIGNSYTDSGVDTKLKRFLEASEPGYCWRVHKYVKGGQTLGGHANDPTLRNKLRNSKYDFVVIQAQSQEPAFHISYVRAHVFPAAKKLVQNIRRGSRNADIIFFDTWGRRNNFRNMQYYLTRRYIEMAKMNKPAKVAPVGEAFSMIRERDRSLFNGLYTSDNSHPRKSGAYVAASVIAQTITGKSNEGSSFRDGLGGTADFYNKAGNDAVKSRNWVF